MTTVFLSHTGFDKPIVRKVQTELTLMGAEPFFDEVSIANGESIPGWIEQALEGTDIFVLFWSEDASKAPWVKTEREAAFGLFHDKPTRFLVVLLDSTPLPPVLRFKKYIDARKRRSNIATEILGLDDDAKRNVAIQQTLHALRVAAEIAPGYGVIAGCLRCGAGLDALKRWSQLDDEHDRIYAGVKCKKCGWEDGSEV